MSESMTLVLFANDLRLSDHPALEAAGERGVVVPVFLHEPLSGQPCATDVWLHHALMNFNAALRDRGSRLVVRPRKQLQTLIQETGATAVYWSRRYDPVGAVEDEVRTETLTEMGVEAKHFSGALLFEPGEVMSASGRSYRVFTPFYHECLKRLIEPAHGEAALRSPKRWPASMKVSELRLLPNHPWARRMMSHWCVGEAGAASRLEQFIAQDVDQYDVMRDRLDVEDAVSRLSPHLRFGHVSPRKVWNAVMQARSRKRSGGADAFLRQLIWREFAYQLLWHFPDTLTEPLNEQFREFPWVDDPAALKRWQQGRTGFPIVDAAMHELWETGYMHNRARMIVASFLTKDLRLHWKHGAAWFMRTLVDADAANNTFGWQWTAGCGADAQPYFRVFNPELQQKKFDPDKLYVERWKGGRGIEPMVDHAAARDAALAAYGAMKKA